MTKLERKYLGLAMSNEALQLLGTSPKRWQSYCNGVGSKVGFWGKLTYHLIPNTIWFLDITPASDIHDVEYYVPDTFPTRAAAIEWKVQADQRFLDNMLALIQAHSANAFMRIVRTRRAVAYYNAVREVGENSFLEGKTIDCP